ncbi:hypothetical protein N657DRAFT_603170 [Parathielavia appendiculata]|uniref:Uncharacterized protein n=1 Tax=Parathielavia appendiculata TaxID=2587402 RepID=A0AAN6TT82_9PEZI|nr:hypothetical protein N657DRAFT_603170 [Parathielavia appendiculata]
MKTLTTTILLLLSLPFYYPFFTQATINWDVFEHGVVPTFHWSRPFPDDGTDPMGFDVHCKASATFHAQMYKLKDLPETPPLGLAPWQTAIEEFLARREYVGSWDGVDHKGLDREVVVMEWVDVPVAVRGWIEEQQRDGAVTNEGKWLFGVFGKPKREGEKVDGTVPPPPPPLGTAMTATAQDVSMSAGLEDGTQKTEEDVVPEVKDEDRIVVFPAGAMYEILPLWVSKGSGCERDFNNLAKYKPRAIDHATIAWPVDHTKPHRDLGKRDITFKITAMAVTETDDAKRARLLWERMHRTIKRNERRQKREERQRARMELEEGRVRDEL